MRVNGLSRLMPGRALGKFVIARELGRGGMGIVYLAEDTLLQRRVALKVVRDDFAEDPRFFQRLRHEARAVAQLSHPNIIHVYGLHEIEGAIAIESEFAAGGSMLTATVLTGSEVTGTLHAIYQVLDALCLCHREGVVHRDIKPSNILFDHHGNVKLADFGLAHAYDDWAARTFAESNSSCVWATPRYAPPEAWEDEQPSPAWDVFSTGVVLYERLCGRMPWDARHPLSLIQRMASQDLTSVETLNSHVSPELSSAVARMLAIRPDDRPANAGDALQLLQRCPEYASAGSKLVSATTSMRSRPRISRPFGRRSRMIAAFAAVALVTSVAWSMYGNLSHLVPRVAASKAIRSDVEVTQSSVIDTWLDSSKDAQASVYSVAAFGDSNLGAPGYWRIREADSRLEVIGYSEHGLLCWSGNVREPGVFIGSGQWAQYQDQVGSVLRTGRFDGEARWIRDSVISLSGTFVADQTDARWQATFVATSEPQLTPARFIHSMESTPAIQALLFNELAPRGNAMVSTVVPLLGAAKPGGLRIREVSGTCNVDGILDESCWLNLSPTLIDEGFAIQDGLKTPGTFLMPLLDGNQLIVGIRVPSPAHGTHAWRIGVALVTQYAIPITASERFYFQVDSAGLQTHEYWVNAVLHPFDHAWEARTKEHAGFYTAEFRVPASALAAAEVRWPLRVVVVCETVDDRGAATPYAWFGYPDPNAPWLGLPIHRAPAATPGV